jgi:cytochrome P450
MPFLHYGPEWRPHRKLAFHALSSSAVPKYEPIQADLAALLCQDILKKPEGFVELVRLVASRIIITITYGISVKEADSSVRHDYLQFAL